MNTDYMKPGFCLPDDEWPQTPSQGTQRQTFPLCVLSRSFVAIQSGIPGARQGSPPPSPKASAVAAAAMADKMARQEKFRIFRKIDACFRKNGPFSKKFRVLFFWRRIRGKLYFRVQKIQVAPS